MKKLKLVIILYVIACIIAVIAALIYVNKDKITLYTEPVIENDISIKAKEIHDYMRENKYGYCTYDSRCNHDGNCGLNVTFEASKTGYHNTCCATYVSWVLQETGYLTAQEHIDNYLNGANNLSRYLVKKGWKEVDKNEKMQPGDILCYNGHIAIYGGRGAQYDAGNRYIIERKAPCVLSWGFDVVKVLRAPEKVELK